MATVLAVPPSRRQNRVVMILVALVFGIVAFEFINDFVQERKARGIVLAALEDDRLSIFLNAKQVSSPMGLLTALKGIQHIGYHHSHPLKPVRVTLLGGTRPLPLLLAPDSTVRDEYWVFLCDPATAQNIPGQLAGRIRSAYLTELFRAEGFTSAASGNRGRSPQQEIAP